MDKEPKTKMIAIRVTDEEKQAVEEAAKDNGFHSVAQFILWLVKKYGKKNWKYFFVQKCIYIVKRNIFLSKNV